MAATNLPGLLFNSVTVTGATTLALLLAAQATVGITGDDAVAIPTTARWVWTAGANCTLGVPAATSPIAGKVVLIFAGEGAVAPGASAVLAPSVATANCLYFGAWVANAGQTVSAADLTGLWSNNAAAAGFTGNGTFTGYMKMSASVIQNKLFNFLSDDYVIVQMEETTGGTFWCWAGFGTRSPTEAGGESGLAGRIFDIGISGATQAVVAAFVATSAGSGGAPMGVGAAAGAGQWVYRVPGQTTSTSATTMRRMSNRAVDTALIGQAISDAVAQLDPIGNLEPDPVICRDVVGSGANDKRKIGRHRAWHYGPKRVTKAKAAAGAAAKWLAVGQSSTVANDAMYVPYA